MNKKKTVLIIFVSILLMIFVSCSDMNPFSAGGVVPGGNWIYFSEGSNIRRMRLDGTEVENVFTVSYVDIGRIQLDPFRQKIYILNFIPNTTNKIYEYNLDGTGEDLIEDLGFSSDIYDMKIDSSAGMLYYAHTGGIVKIDLVSGSTTTIETVALTNASSLTPDYQGNIYYTVGVLLKKLVISTQSSNSITTTPALASPSGISYDRNNVNFYLYDSNFINRISGSTSTAFYGSPGFVYAKNTEISSTENKLFFVRDITMIFRIYSINLDGSGLKELLGDSPALGGFDILSK